MPGRRRFRAEAIAVVWEVFSVLLFVSAVVPAALKTWLPGLLFGGTLVLSIVIAPRLLALGERGFAVASAVRALAWPLATLPLFSAVGIRGIVAALAFGMMASGMRAALYRRVVDRPEAEIDVLTLRRTLSARLAESAMLAGIAGGHVLLLFCVAFLRTQSQVIFRLWFQIVPGLALLGTISFTLSVRPATRWVGRALDAGPTGDPDVLRRGLEQARRFPDWLGFLNFALWFVCTTVGIYFLQRETASSTPGGTVLQMGFAALFAWGVAFYQRSWHRDTATTVENHLRRWLAVSASAEPITIRRRMLRDFGLPLLFTGLLSLFSSIALYRALGRDLGFREDFNAISALTASFALMVLAVGGVVVRAATALARPMTELAAAADRVAHGQLDAAVPGVEGPVEVVGLGASIERMRQGLATTIAELEKERAGLERNVEVRTAELSRALEELKRTQAALVQGERLASIGELVAGVAHEIYNPLNAIKGAADPLENLVLDLRRVLEAYRSAEASLPADERRGLELLRKDVDLDASLDDLVGISTVVKRAIERSVRIVTNLRNFSRGAGEEVPSDLHACLEETLMLLAPRLRQANVSVVRDLGELPPVVCRAGEINQVFMNLLVNALQSLETAKTREPEIRLETRLDGAEVVLAVTDNGPGVPRELQPRIFDPFFTTKPRGQGTGLGLSISSDILRRHGGSLTLSPVDRGARFVIRLPLAPVQRESGRSASGSVPDGLTPAVARDTPARGPRVEG
jgi:signal transduction histidine kinase